MDVALDLQGSFLPGYIGCDGAFEHLRGRLQRAMDGIFLEKAGADRNFLARTAIGGLKVRVGDNQLPSCYQYLIKGNDGERLFTVKMYDKVLDLISREATFQVGSRIKEVLCAKKVPD